MARKDPARSDRFVACHFWQNEAKQGASVSKLSTYSVTLPFPSVFDSFCIVISRSTRSVSKVSRSPDSLSCCVLLEADDSIFLSLYLLCLCCMRRKNSTLASFRSACHFDVVSIQRHERHELQVEYSSVVMRKLKSTITRFKP